MTATPPNDKQAMRRAARASLTEARKRAAGVPVPITIKYSMIAAGVQIVLGLIAAVLCWGFTSKLQTLLHNTHFDLIKNWATDNKLAVPTSDAVPQSLITAYNAKNKNHWQPFCSSSTTTDCFGLAKSVHDFRIQITLTTLVSAVLIVLLWLRIRQGAGMARWIYLALCTVGAFIGMPLTIFYLGQFGSKFPKPIGVAQSLSALACVVALVLLVIAPSARYFRAAREASGRPSAFAAGGGAAGGRRGGLFGGLTQPAGGARSTAATADPTAGKTKAKVRSADTSAAKGAELARARAKESKAKSRKSPDPTR